MKKAMQTIMVVPIAETIGKAFGDNTLLGTGASIVAARLVLRSFGGMLALGAIAGCLSYLRNTPVKGTTVRQPARKPVAPAVTSKT